VRSLGARDAGGVQYRPVESLGLRQGDKGVRVFALRRRLVRQPWTVTTFTPGILAASLVKKPCAISPEPARESFNFLALLNPARQET
jgi:hypothetical protein